MNKNFGLKLLSVIKKNAASLILQEQAVSSLKLIPNAKALPIACVDLGGGNVLDLAAHLQRFGGANSELTGMFGGEHNSSMLDFINATSERPHILEDLKNFMTGDDDSGVVGNGGASGAASLFHEDDIIPANAYTLDVPIRPHRNLMCIGKNYSDHIAEINRINARKETAQSSGAGVVIPVETIKVPVIFTKVPQTLVPHGGPVESHAGTTRWLDYEVELAVIIGKKCRDVSEDDAMQAVFGYTIANDVTARDVQKRHLQWFKGKSLDTTCPLGPSIIHANSHPHIDPHNLKLKTWINGELRQDSNTSNLIFKIPRLISDLSKGFTLLPGDVILTGTPDGVGYAMDPPQILQPGDKMVLEIEHLGKLENHIVG